MNKPIHVPPSFQIDTQYIEEHKANKKQIHCRTSTMKATMEIIDAAYKSALNVAAISI